VTDPCTPAALWDAFDATCSAYADHDFLHVPATDEGGSVTLTYADVRTRVDEIGARLTSVGYARGHRVALALDNRPDFFLYLLALNRIGCSAVPLNAAMSREELNYVLTHADVAAVFAHESHLSRLRSALPTGVPLAESSYAQAVSPCGGPIAGAQEAALLYTSGTTGTPKGCILTQEYFQQIGRLYVSLGGYCAFRLGQERLITPLPVTHMNALGCSLMAVLLTGGCLIQLDRFHPSSWWRSVRESRATCFHYLGVMPAMLLKAAPSPDDDFGGVLRFGFGAGVDPRHHAAFEERFGVPLIEAWAMTETGGAAWITANQEPRHVGQRCFGRAPAGLEWKLATESGSDASVGEPGELWVRRTGVDPRGGFFGGYYKDDEATEAAWAQGWFHTGDIVRVDAAGSFYFVDRLKNVIRRSGENIAAVEVESILAQHCAVGACAVTAVQDEVRGEEVFAFIVAASGVETDLATVERLQRHCLDALAYFKAPGFIAFIERLPQTASQKLARGEVKRLAARCVVDGRAFDLRAAKKRRVSVGS
jgi:acyl-CoA synthetase (AMP-forming)/AMP-acid ligase II